MALAVGPTSTGDAFKLSLSTRFTDHVDLDQVVAVISGLDSYDLDHGIEEGD
jgi:hypothetical protein